MNPATETTSSSLPSLAALRQVTDRLKTAGVHFALGGSGLLYALGLTQAVRDWDLTTDASLADVSAALAGLNWKQVPAVAPYASDFLLHVEVETTGIDIIGGFRIEGKHGDSFQMPFATRGEWQGIPLAQPEGWLAAYEKMDRPHRAYLLKRHLNVTQPEVPVSTETAAVFATTGDERRGPGQIALYRFSKQEILFNSLKKLALFWGLAVVSVFIPVMHFFLVPGFFLLGIFVFFRTFRAKAKVLHGFVACPHCHHEIRIPAGLIDWPLKEICQNCVNTVRISPEAVELLGEKN